MTILPTGSCKCPEEYRTVKVEAFTDRIADVWVCQMEAYRGYTKVLKNVQNVNCWPGAGAVRLWQKRSDKNFYAADPHSAEGNSYVRVRGGSQDGFRNMFEETAIHPVCSLLRRSIWKEPRRSAISVRSIMRRTLSIFLPPEERKNFAANCWRTGRCRSLGTVSIKRNDRLSSRAKQTAEEQKNGWI